jgi:hypothetical protein
MSRKRQSRSKRAIDIFYGTIGSNLFGDPMSPVSELVSRKKFKVGDRVRVTVERIGPRSGGRKR